MLYSFTPFPRVSPPYVYLTEKKERRERKRERVGERGRKSRKGEESEWVRSVTIFLSFSTPGIIQMELCGPVT